MYNKEAILILITSICEGVRGSATCSALGSPAKERYVRARYAGGSILEVYEA